MLAVPRFVELELIVKLLMAEVGENSDAPAQERRLAVLAVNGVSREGLVLGLIVEKGMTDLFEIVGACRAFIAGVYFRLRCGLLQVLLLVLVDLLRRRLLLARLGANEVIEHLPVGNLGLE